MGQRGEAARRCWLLAGLLAASEARGEPLTLEEALASAALRNETPAIAEARLEAAEAIRREAFSELIPALTVSGSYTRRAREVTRTVDEEELTIQAIDALDGEALLEAQLFDLRSVPAVRAAGAGLAAQRFESLELERALAFDVANTFYGILSAEELAAAAEQRVAVARTTAEEAAIRLDAGLAARNELTRTRLELATAELAATEADELVRSTRLALGYLIGEAIGERPLAARAPPPSEERAAPALVDRAMAASAELAALERRAQEARHLARVPHLGLVPTLDLRGLYRATNESGLSGVDSDWNVALNLTWEMFDGGSRGAEAMRLAAEAREAELALAQRRREVGLEVEQALAEVASAEAALVQASVQSEVADQNADEVRERFQQGLATGLELADALAQRFTAAAEVASQGFSRRLAQLALERSLGVWPGGGASPPQPAGGMLDGAAAGRAGASVVSPPVGEAMEPRPHLVLLAGLLALAGCGGEEPSGGGAAAVPQEVRFPVEVEPVALRAVEYAVRAVGSVEAFERVEATARVAGVVEQVRFQEGDLVDPARVLAEIEPERHRLSAESARATVAQAEAAEQEARAGYERRLAVNERNPDLVRAEEVDAWRTRLASASAGVAQAEAALALAELNLRDAYVRAPVAGVIQTRSVQTGQYVQPGAVLATLLRREPLLLRFGVPEAEAGPLAAGQPLRFTVRAGEGTYTATITHVAAAAAEQSRMVEITARVDDPARGELRPGAFAEVEVPVGSATDAPVVPQTAIRPSERGFLAFVVEDERAVERVLTLGLRTPDGRVEVRSGIEAGERLVVRGAEALRDGALVRVADAEPQRDSPAEGGP